MIKLIVSRDDHIYECFPDIAMTPDGTLVCIYRESMQHAPFPFSRIAVRRSLDGGRTWLPKQIIDECVSPEKHIDKNRSWLSDDEISGYEESKARITESWKNGASINCMRLLCLSDGQLIMIADYAVHYATGNRDYKWINLIYRSFNSGVTWVGPEDPGISNALVPSLNELRDGRLMLGLARSEQDKKGASKEIQLVFFSDDKGKSWSDPVEIPSESGQNFSEGSFVELDDGTILGILRDDNLGRAYKTLSYDGGQTWKGPFPTQLIGLEGRPKTGLLRSGEICITYRMGVPNEMLALHLMTQEAAKHEGASPRVKRQPIPEDWIDVNDSSRPSYMTSYYPGITYVIDIDRSVHRDGGYSGWVQLDSGDIYVVDYINDDAPLAHIRGYIVTRSDCILFPEGDLPWLHPSGQPFVKMTFGMAERQFKANQIKGGGNKIESS
ncbi:MAG: sialidase family protein [bacterium]|nr:sialidase family protein [bacterium]